VRTRFYNPQDGDDLPVMKEASNMPSIVSIHSFRGGTGKSNITANVATMVSQQGRRVGVVDTDIQSPGIHTLFGLDAETMDRALNDYLWGKCAVEQTAYDVGPALTMGEGEIVVMGAGIYLIPSTLKAGEIAKVLREGYDVGLLNEGFRELITRLNLDYLFIDTHPGLNEETLLSIAISDILLIILRPDQQDYQGTAVTVEVTRKLGVPRMYLVINKVLTSLDFDKVKAKMEEAYDCEVAAVLPLSEDVVRLASAGIFCLRYPDHPFTQGLGDIAGKVLSRWPVGPADNS
jgi:MinD-like ATPase involved in chromosome partitioning or flagellar assembly